MPSYRAAVAQLYQLGHELARTPSAKFDPAHMRVLLEALGQPERTSPSVLIAGTNGKGSTASTLASILQAAGHRTGLYTSPHLLRINQRIRVNGEEISDHAFAAVYDRVERVAVRLTAERRLPWHPSFFEMLTAMALTHFGDISVDVAVLEVGMGGRLDATNVVDPVVSVITDISLDHQKYLGDTLSEIAREKAGIVRHRGVVVTLPQDPEIDQVIAGTIRECEARAVSAAPYLPAQGVSPPPISAMKHEPSETARNRYLLEVFGQEILVDSPLLGQHQRRNIALAVAAAEQLSRQTGLQVSSGDVERGIRQTNWPGRFQIIPAMPHNPECVLDVAHNPAGARALHAELCERYLQSGNSAEPSGTGALACAPNANTSPLQRVPASRRPLILVFGVMRDKPIAEMAAILFPLAQQVIVTQAKNPRAAAGQEIRAATEGICKDISIENDVTAAVKRASDLAGESGLVVITGSIYVVGEAVCALESAGILSPGLQPALR
ncbi:MAG: folylpolyglutamate synthase/dihydrofolate synthase family protein [Terriglobales bacterium]